jgi:predicted MPP superfamily phosphohydrolase
MTKFFLFISVFTLFTLIIDFYSYQGIKQLTEKYPDFWRKLWRRLFWLPSIMALILIVIVFIWSEKEVKGSNFKFFYFVTGFIFIALAPKVVFLVFHFMNDLVRIGKWIVRKLKGLLTKIENTDFEEQESDKMTRFQFFNQVGLGAAAVTMGATFYGIFKGKYDFRVCEESLNFPNLPQAFNGLRIVQISDAHLGSFLDNSFEEVQGALKRINDLNPDVIFFTGDLVNNLADEAEPWVSYFSQLNAPLGKFSILGNHDYAEYVYDPNDAANAQILSENMLQLESVHERMGFRLLKNETVELEKLGERISLIGIENWGKGRFSKHGKLDLAMTNMPQNDFTILLSHDPSHWEAQVLGQQNIDLTFSGHTHGAQFGIEAPMLHIKASPSPWFGYKRWGGLYQEGKQYLYVNRGFGFLGFPGRVGMPPEITLVTIFSA